MDAIRELRSRMTVQSFPDLLAKCKDPRPVSVRAEGPHGKGTWSPIQNVLECIKHESPRELSNTHDNQCLKKSELFTMVSPPNLTLRRFGCLCISPVLSEQGCISLRDQRQRPYSPVKQIHTCAIIPHISVQPIHPDKQNQAYPILQLYRPVGCNTRCRNSVLPVAMPGLAECAKHLGLSI